MKKTIILTVCAMAALAACEKNDPTPVPTEGKLSCTMAIYGCGGGSSSNASDVDYVNELIGAMRIGPSQKVNVIAQYNFTSNDASLNYVNGTAIMCLKARNRDIEEIDDSIYEGKVLKSRADSNAVRIKAIDAKLKELVDAGAYSFQKLDGKNKVKMYQPSDISAFLDRVAKDFPADHYLFCIPGHGGSWDAEDDRDGTRALAYDSNFLDSYDEPIGITAKNLTAGISGSTIAGKIPVVYFNACSMNLLENLCEYADCPATYALISFMETTGTDNEKVMKELVGSQGNDVQDLVNALLAAYESIYRVDKDCDISLIRIKEMKTAATDIKDLVPLFKVEYEKDKDFYNGLLRGLNSPDGKTPNCNKDFSQFLDKLSKMENLDTAMKTIVAKIQANVKASVVRTFYGKDCHVRKDLLTGVKFIGKTAYSKSCEDFAASYQNNAFYKLTGWNTLFTVFDDSMNSAK